MSLDGLRAWIGEVERKLGMRTRVFLVLVAIAVGGSGAAIYLALKAEDDAVSKSEVQALRERVEATGTGAGTLGEAAVVSALRAELETLRNQVAELQGKGAVASPGGTSPPEGKGAQSEKGKERAK
jgi:hypothetical protein